MPLPSGPRILFPLLALVMLAPSCGQPEKFDRDRVGTGIEERIGRGIGPQSPPGEVTIPPDVPLDDGVTPDEAAAIALWNNPAFQEAVATLGYERADLVKAGLLQNPVFSILFPIDSKPLEFTLTLPLEALVYMPRRVEIAELQCERAAQTLVLAGLDVVRDTKVDHAALILSGERLRLAKEALALRGDLAGLAEARLRAGDASELEASAAVNDRLRAEEDVRRLEHDAALAEERLRGRLGLSLGGPTLSFVTSDGRAPPPDAEGLVDLAMAARPDVKAAEISLEAAGKRAGLARWEFLVFAAALDAENPTEDGFAIGPGLDVEIPIFDRNQDGVALADTDLEVAARRYVAVRQGIALEVRESHRRWVQAREEIEGLRDRVIPAYEETVRRAEKAFAAGEVSYIFVLEATRGLIEVRLREAEAAADLRRALAELEHGCGCRLDLARSFQTLEAGGTSEESS